MILLNSPSATILILRGSLIYLSHRYYDPITGQLTLVDPILSQANDANADATGDPVNNSDPSGIMTICPSSEMMPNSYSPPNSNEALASCQIDMSTARAMESLGFSAQDITNMPTYVHVKAGGDVCPNGSCWVYTPIFFFTAHDHSLASFGIPNSGKMSLLDVEHIVYWNLYRPNPNSFPGIALDNTFNGFMGAYGPGMGDEDNSIAWFQAVSWGPLIGEAINILQDEMNSDMKIPSWLQKTEGISISYQVSSGCGLSL